MVYESFNTSKKKIEKNWNRTEENSNNESKLKKQNIIPFQNNRNPSLTTISLLSKIKIENVSENGTITLNFRARVLNFIIAGFQERFIPYASVFVRVFPEDEDVAIFKLDYIEKLSLDHISWKANSDDSFLLEIFLPTVNVQTPSFIEVDLIINNPNDYAPIPKSKI